MIRPATVTGTVRHVGRYCVALTWPDGLVQHRRVDSLREANQLKRSRESWGIRVDVFRITIARA